MVLTLGTAATSTYYHHHQLKWPSLPAAITNCALHLFYMCRFTPECILQYYSALTPLYLRHRNCPSPHLGMFTYCSKREKKDTENRGLNTSSLPGPRLKKKNINPIRWFWLFDFVQARMRAFPNAVFRQRD